jgi:hypothetical protein
LKPFDEPVSAEVQRQCGGHGDGRQQDRLNVVAGRRMGALGGSDPRVVGSPGIKKITKQRMAPSASMMKPSFCQISALTSR